MKKHKRGSMFDEKRDMIVQMLDEGYSIKAGFDVLDNNTGFYEYGSFYYYVQNVLRYKFGSKASCETCQHIIQAYAPTSLKYKPVCVARKRIMRTDFKDKPYKCQFYEKKGD